MFRPHVDRVPELLERDAEHFLQAPAERRFVLGRNRYAASIAELCEVHGFIDDYSAECEFAGKPVLRTADLPAEAAVASAVVEAKPITALENLRRAGVRRFIDYFTLARLRSASLEPIPYAKFNHDDILDNADRYTALYDRLEDDLSRRTLECVTQFRLNLDLSWMRGFRVDVERQYFDDCVPLAAGEVFVDGGGYDGDTAERLMQRCPNSKVFLFEPNVAMMSRAQQRLANFANITYLPMGLFDREGSARFDDHGGSASKLDDSGTVEVPLTSLDHAISDRVTFLKLDIEGAELEALHGAEQHIVRDKPILAVSVYHDQRHFWRVPEFVLRLNSQCRIFLRHYTEGPLETVMYFIPETR